MKVLLVSQPASDGVFRHVEALAGYLIEQGVQVYLAYSDRGACQDLHALVDRVTAAGGGTLNLRVGNQPGPSDVSAWFALWRFARRIEPDIIHAHSSKAGALVRGSPLLGFRSRIFYTPHAYYRMNAPRGMKARFFHAIERVLRHIGTTITCSSDEAEFARDHIGVPEGGQRTIPNGVDCHRFRPAASGESRVLRAEFGVPPNALVLGTVGRFSTQKDPLTVYHAFARVAAQIPQLFFVHLGKGELEGEVDQLLARYNLTGRCLRIPYLADTAPFYRMLDGFVLTSLYEGMSYAVIEGTASDLPLILSRAPGNQDFARYPLNCIHWVEPGDVQGLTEAIIAWERETVAKRVAPNHRAVAVDAFSSKSSYARVLNEYRESMKFSTPSNVITYEKSLVVR